MLNLAVSHGLLQGIGPEGLTAKVTCLQYADDTLLFCRAREDYLYVLKLILYSFEKASGLNINFSKSSLYLLEDDSDKLQ